jgi:hypothetical protein
MKFNRGDAPSHGQHNRIVTGCKRHSRVHVGRSAHKPQSAEDGDGGGGRAWSQHCLWLVHMSP